MSSNSTTITDEDGDFSDWIELYNPSDEDIDLVDFYLSDSKNNHFKWLFPRVTISAKSFLLIWASSKDKVSYNGEIHANFKIDKDGETLYLSDSDRQLIDSVKVLKMPADFVYARLPDGTRHWQISDQASPWNPNLSPAGFIETPSFSHLSGLYTQAFKLKLSHPDEEVIIIYTTDGSEPSIDNLNGKTYIYKNSYKETLLDKEGKSLEGFYKSIIYQNEINIDSIIKRENSISEISTTYHASPDYFPRKKIEKCAVIKAIAYKDNQQSDVITNSYFISDNPKFQIPITTLSISTNDTNLFDFTKGIYVAGKDFEDWRKTDFISPANPSRPANYNRKGKDNEYQLTLEVFNPDSKSKSLEQNIGFRIQGSSTRIHPQKSLKLYAREEYGKSKLKSDFFPKDKDNSYKRITLRSLYGRRFGDSFFAAMVNHLNLDVQYDLPVITFLNGEYYGMFELKEKFTKHYLNRKYGADKEKVDIISNYFTLKEGDKEKFSELMNFVKNSSLTNNFNYNKIESMVDIDNYIDYQSIEIFSGNTDWPQNNVLCWRAKENQSNNTPSNALDGRWRWMLFDMDYALGTVDKTLCTNNTLASSIGDGKEQYQILFFKLLQNQTFKTKFINRFADLLNTTFLPDRLLDVLEQKASAIAPYIGNHIERWNMDENAFNKANERATAYVRCRRNEVFKHLRNYFNSGEIYDLTVDVDFKENGHKIKVNTIVIDSNTVGISAYPYPWTGNYFSNIPVEIKAIPALGYKFSHWESMPENTPASFIGTFENDTKLTAHFTKVQDPVSLTYTSSKGGFIRGDSVQVIERNTDGIKIEAVAHTGYSFDSWSDGTKQNPRTDRNVQEDISVEAIFKSVTGIVNYKEIISNIYPNPTRDILSIELNKTNQNLHFQLLNLQGQNFMSGTWNKQKETININHLPPSIYILWMENESGDKAFFKIIKE